ncbi:YgaP family membrane protein [Bhargavaea beijingensis]|uniref:DUF2892 domain-containing protein n=1 Tax=Bhargavaea beijingensis TaxID=426756 RepID=A0A1G7B3U2_9BACL|nr:DUF2892 domain-containing protein [Bhargavaea beijingensis]MCW1928334.1 DUF2892 domain-containing protein [Bhargavaea beijingensis]RSK32580.1 DUF2892 domain-containing protein [Bhargavaea beijingensis]SDE21622.1 Protein of unknown function [Bhargavaea beijingensis]
MKPTDQTINVGTKSAYLRISSGLAMLAWGTSRMIRDPRSMAGPILVLSGACKTAEGITRYCPMKEMMSGGMDALMKPEVSGGTLPAVSGGGTESGESGEKIQAFSYGGFDGAGSEQNVPSGQDESAYKNTGSSGQGQKKDPMQSI